MEDWFCLEGQNALVVGASRGLGREIALALARAGASVACAARTVGRLEELQDEIRSLGRSALAIPVDVTSEEEVTSLVEAVERAWGNLNILVYTAGILESRPTLEMSLADWFRTINTNLTGAFLICREAGKVMRKGGGGRIILVSSAFADRILPQVLPYVVSKGGVNQMVRNLAFEWSRYGIRVNGIAPGYFNTEMTGEALKDPKIREAILKRIPIRRVGEPWEIGPLAVYLASPVSDYMTGEIIRIDGGQANFTV